MTRHIDARSVQAFIAYCDEMNPAILDMIQANSDTEFENAFSRHVEQALINLESQKRLFTQLGEVGLTAFLVNSLNAPGIYARAEVYINGHVDITIDVPNAFPSRRVLGEAKIYRGYKYHIDGLNQLLARYSTGREAFGLMITYFRLENMTSLISNLREQLSTNLPLGQRSSCADHKVKWAFISEHNHTSGATLRVCHFGCNMFLKECVETN